MRAMTQVRGRWSAAALTVVAFTVIGCIGDSVGPRAPEPFIWRPVIGYYECLHTTGKD